MVELQLRRKQTDHAPVVGGAIELKAAECRGPASGVNLERRAAMRNWQSSAEFELTTGEDNALKEQGVKVRGHFNKDQRTHEAPAQNHSGQKARVGCGRVKWFPSRSGRSDHTQSSAQAVTV